MYGAIYFLIVFFTPSIFLNALHFIGGIIWGIIDGVSEAIGWWNLINPFK